MDKNKEPKVNERQFFDRLNKITITLLGIISFILFSAALIHIFIFPQSINSKPIIPVADGTSLYNAMEITDDEKENIKNLYNSLEHQNFKEQRGKQLIKR